MKSQEYFLERDPIAFPLWQKAVVGIAGAGGLGSNIAMLLARAGIGKLIISDFDVVTLSNLGRQAFTLEQVGMHKVEAVAQNIAKVNPFTLLEIHKLRLDDDKVRQLFHNVDVMIEAFDTADAKTMLIECFSRYFPDIPLICASGLAGYGRSEEIRIVQDGSLYVVGDQSSQLRGGIAPISARVMIVAAMQANLALERIACKSS
ncbi:MAG: sulfur carrier protein ThiS adenylyltransferase ThiF [Candidatus Cloacimonadaceae bacterium]|jgi:sulfur carrier protein ThiS adenylyltransferase|nr:sulfur carrier protein ThiS adenylyltransferase ThiF [Candidatus Cloacimonadota bacterium]MDY0127901.1 sulfur carrier protein ThiS adenylyltransferase ThiF [Candidatus Cloacimonadaceae bacterium]MCB5255796.1 sulfur carrier protein ThiS adenylyltransferase ThiF [Candidatus Cloacimonadota bacterium]MCK9178317.1 sulfur carrier protein ThiS adenylyltransferase ThiF [Candidatus Cloacimonadota bacterium]MCK9243034.1 sulfur carrier protein ThiS adenylyltransferase ThiF [Candidatus Cloacimonadota ba